MQMAVSAKLLFEKAREELISPIPRLLRMELHIIHYGIGRYFAVIHRKSVQ